MTDKPLVWLHGEVHTPPFTVAARLEAVDEDAIVIGDVFSKKTRTTPEG